MSNKNSSSNIIRLDKILEKAKWYQSLDDIDKQTCRMTLSYDLQEGCKTGNWIPFQHCIEAWERRVSR